MDTLTRDRMLRLAGIEFRNWQTQVRDPGGEDGGQWVKGPASALKDVLKLAGRIKLDDGETLVGSDKVQGGSGTVRMAVTERAGQRLLRLGVGDEAFGSRDDEAGPWLGRDHIAEENARRAPLRAERDALEVLDGPTPEQIARYDELDDMDLAEVYASGHTARLDPATAARLHEALAGISKRARSALAEQEAVWDAFPDGPGSPPVLEVAEGFIPAEWGEIHYEAYVDEPASGLEVYLWIVPPGQTSQEVRNLDERAYLNAAELAKVVRLLTKVGGDGGVRSDEATAETRHRMLALLGVEVRAVPDDTPDDDTAVLVAAIRHLVYGEERDWTPAQAEKHPRGPGGRFRSLTGVMATALHDFLRGDGPDNPLTGFNREQVRRAAKALEADGMPAMRRGATEAEIKDALLEHVRASFREVAEVDANAPKPERKFTLKGKAHRDTDVGLYQEKDGRVSLYEESDNGQRGARVTTQPDVAALGVWAEANDEPDVAAWAASRTDAPEAPAPATKAAKKAPPRKAPAEAVAVSPGPLSGRDALLQTPAVAPHAFLAGEGPSSGTVSLTVAQKKALNDYANDAQRINDQIRSGTMSARTATAVRQLDQVVAKSPLRSDVELWRGLSDGETVFGDGLSGDLTGHDWIEEAFLSTSADRRVAAQFGGAIAPDRPTVVMRLVAPAGTGAVTMSAFGSGSASDSQAEVLLRRGLHLRVVADHGTSAEPGVPDGVRRLDVEVVPDGPGSAAPAKRAPAKVSTPSAAAARRSITSLLTEADELVSNGAEADVLRERIRRSARRLGAPDAVRDDLLQAVDSGPDKVRAAIDRQAKSAGIEIVRRPPESPGRIGAEPHGGMSGSIPASLPVTEAVPSGARPGQAGPSGSSRLRDIVASGEVDRTELSGGETSQTSRVQFSDGTSLIEKATEDDEELELDAATLADAENLGSSLGRAIGAPVPEVYRASDSTIYMSIAPGRSYAEAQAQSLYGDGPPIADLERRAQAAADSDGGRLLGLLDILADNWDRNPGNWLLDDNGNPYGIDHALLWDAPTISGDRFGPDYASHPTRISYSTDLIEGQRLPEPIEVTYGVPSPFAAHYVSADGTEWVDNDLSPDDVLTVRERLEALRPEFERSGRGDWLDFALERLNAVGQHATGTGRRIA